jgi:MFS family permease
MADGNADGGDKPFNNLLSLVVAIDLLANAASFTLVFPFMGFMVIDLTDCSPAEAGYYAGWLASSIMVGRAISAVPWGWFSDRWGRVPVMVVGNAGISVCALLFGLSKSLSWAIGTRALMGLISGGLVGTAKVTAPRALKRGRAKARYLPRDREHERRSRAPAYATSRAYRPRHHRSPLSPSRALSLADSCFPGLSPLSPLRAL